jgi:hypothetical protein
MVMNQRFQELIRLADVHILPDDSEYGHRIIGLEKFAELIVRECAGIYSKIDNGNLHMGTDDYLEALHKTFRS